MSDKELTVPIIASSEVPKGAIVSGGNGWHFAGLTPDGMVVFTPDKEKE